MMMFSKEECEFLLELLSDYDDCLRESGYRQEYQSVLKKLHKEKELMEDSR